MSSCALWVRRGAIEAHFRVVGDAAQAGRWTLVGWSESPPAADGGLPPALAALWTRALATTARTTFLCSVLGVPRSADWTTFDGDMVRSADAGGRIARAWARLSGAPQQVALVSTRRERTLANLFTDAGFPWWLQAQVALLSAPDSPPPRIDVASVLALLELDGLRGAQSLRPLGIQAVLRPGVDGDVAGLLGLDGDLDTRLIESLESQARRAGVDWSGER